MSIDALVDILPPPIHPIDNLLTGWSDIEAQLGASLPDDYKAFNQIYGGGFIGRFLEPFVPVSEIKGVRLVEEALATNRRLQEWKEREGVAACPYSLFPQDGGLLAWGHTVNGDTLSWLTEGDPNSWIVVVGSMPVMPEYYRYDVNMTDFLVRILTRELRCPLFPSKFPPKKPLFEQSWT